MLTTLKVGHGDPAKSALPAFRYPRCAETPARLTDWAASPGSAHARRLIQRDLVRGLVQTQPLERWMPQLAVGGAFGELDLRH
jgi:hypothetical protein